MDLMNYEFTAKLENELDEVATGDVDRQKMLADFWDGFEPHIEASKESDRIQMLTGKPCPKCET